MSQWIPERKVYLSFLIDTNCVNSRQQMPAINQLEEWAAKGLITLLTAQAAQNEMLAGSNAMRRAKAYTFIFTMPEITTDQEREILERIQRILFPGGAQTTNQRNDVEIVFNSGKYMRPLVTNDGASKSQPAGILGNRDNLSTLGVTVLTPEEAVAKVRKEIEFRDKSARKMAELTGEPLPDWVGKD